MFLTFKRIHSRAQGQKNTSKLPHKKNVCTESIKTWTLLHPENVNEPELLPYALHSVSTDDEHLRHVVCQHLAGVTDVYSRLWMKGNNMDLLRPVRCSKHICSVFLFFCQTCKRVFEFSTLLVACENPNLNVSQGENGNGLWDAFLQLVLYGCGAQQLKTQSRLHRNQIKVIFNATNTGFNYVYAKLFRLDCQQILTTS